RTLAWYGDPATDELTPDQLAALDARRRRRNTDVTVLGLDASVPAIRYATRAGLIADGWAENLEDAEPSTALAGGIADVGMIISTGGFGYVTHRTFARLLRTIRAPEDLWLVIFVLRVFDYTDMITLLADYGLVTERIGDTFRQRRFATADERAAAIHDVRARGLDPTGKESDGWYHAECFLSRPATANR
ncbi:MAG: hypothetical protein J2O49_04625, partial [Sciscionella sp.]|nr:hypothetical protein [Sciscionella sp.]